MSKVLKSQKIWKSKVLWTVAVILGLLFVISMAAGSMAKADEGGGLSLSLSFGEIKELVCLIKECPVEAPQNLGAVVGPDIFVPFLNVNGAQTHYYGERFVSATNTVWRFQTNANATTSNEVLCRINVASTSATIWTLAESDGGYATTTAYVDQLVGADTQADLLYLGTTTLTTPPNTTLILSVSGGVSGEDEFSGVLSPGFAPEGSCNIWSRTLQSI